MKLLLAAFGTVGDVFPFLDMAQAAARRGHDVVLVVAKRYLAQMRALGLVARPMEEAIVTRLWLPGLNRLSADSWSMASTRYILPQQPALYHGVEAAIQTFRPDVVITQHFGCAAAWAADRHRVPWVMAAAAPASWSSLDDPVMYSVMPDKDRYRPWLIRLGNAAGSMATTLITDPPLNRIRKQLGLASTRRIMLERMFEGRLTLGLWSPSFRAPAGDDKPRSRICGFTWFDGRALPENVVVRNARQRLDRFLAAGEAPIVFTLGSFISRDAGHFHDTAVQACRRLGRRGIVLSEQTSADEKDGILRLGFLPHSRVFPHAAAIVHHGGLGTTAQALRSARPGVVIPWCLDQFDNARRSRLLGASITLRRRKLNSTVLADGLHRVLSEPEFGKRARRVAAGLQAEDGALTAVKALEEAL